MPQLIPALTLAVLVAAAPRAHADESRHSAGGSLWLNVRGTTSTVGVDAQGTYRPGPHQNLQILYGLGLARIGVGCDSGEVCGANEARAFLGVGVTGCTHWVCATAGLAAVGRRHRERSLDPVDPVYAPLLELRASLELGYTTRFRLGGRLETSRPTYNDMPYGPRAVLELGVVSTF